MDDADEPAVQCGDEGATLVVLVKPCGQLLPRHEGRNVLGPGFISPSSTTPSTIPSSTTTQNSPTSPTSSSVQVGVSRWATAPARVSGPFSPSKGIAIPSHAALPGT